MTAGNLSPFIKQVAKTAYSLGKDNKPLNVVLTIALFKGINRPLFTMMDKNSNPESKKYAAFREGLTEVIAASTYLATDKLLVNPLTNFLHKKAPAANKTKIGKAMEFFCVCLSAAILIPAVCNLVLKPVMDVVSKLGKKKKDGKLDVKDGVTNPIQTLEMPKMNHIDLKNAPKGPNSLMKVMQNTYASNSGNMKVGL